MYVSVADWFGKIVKLSQLAGSAGGCGLHAARRGTRSVTHAAAVAAGKKNFAALSCC